MAINLIDSAKSFLTDAVISRTSNSLGENPDGVQKALGGAIPLVLSMLINRSSSSEGPGFLGTLLRPFMNATTTGTTMGDADDMDSLMTHGSGLIDTLFGSHGNQISSALSQYSGVKSASATGLLGMAGALISRLLSRHATSQNGNVDVSSLTSLLADQRNSVQSAMPAGLSTLLGNIPGLSGLMGLGTRTTEMRDADSSTVRTQTTTTPVQPHTNPAPVHHEPAREPEGFKLWPWLLALLAAAALFYFMRGCGDRKDTPAVTTDTTTTTSASSTDNMADDNVATATGTEASATNGDASVGAFAGRKLADGVELNIPANGIENKLISFIEDRNRPVDKTTWFNFDRLLYETASAKLKPESREQLQNIAAIMKAYPAVNLKIGGYTDNTGKAAANKKLSQDRADAAKNELVRLGVAASRLEAEGYGSEHPVASNATEAGRTQNRRTACRVTKK